MTQPVMFISIPLHSKWVPACLEKIIDKKINRIALNCLERLLDFLCSKLYFPYRRLLAAKLARIHLFSDKTTKLFDATAQGIAGIKAKNQAHLIDGGDIRITDYVTLNRKRVFFDPDPGRLMIFSHEAYTESVYVSDAEEKGPGWYRIAELALGRPDNPRPMPKTWFVNTNQLHDIFAPLGPFREKEQGYLVEQMGIGKRQEIAAAIG
ncbi:MAG: hypothetical protein V4487_08025 [Chlamydiota bacterium]